MIRGIDKSMIRGIDKSMIRGIDNSTIVRKKSDVGKGRPKLNIKEDILKILRKTDKPVSTSDLTVFLGKAWHTIDRACLMLQIEGKIDGFKVGKMNLWRLK